MDPLSHLILRRRKALGEVRLVCVAAQRPASGSNTKNVASVRASDDSYRDIVVCSLSKLTIDQLNLPFTLVS